jgi:hypothetical protein
LLSSLPSSMALSRASALSTLRSARDTSTSMTLLPWPKKIETAMRGEPSAWPSWEQPDQVT